MCEALWYEKLEEEKVQCKLCAHDCVIKDGNLGICRIRKNKSGKLYSLTNGKFYAEQYDAIEKKPLSLFHPGSVIYSVGTVGCNFHCDFCQNWQLAQGDVSVEFGKIEDDELLRRATLHGSVGIAFTYNEPTVNYETMLRVSKKAKNRNLITAAISNGYLNEGPMEEITEYIDAWNIDLKMMNRKNYRKICGGDPDTVLRNIGMANKKAHVEVTTLLIDGVNTSDEEIEELVKSIAFINPEIPLHFNRFFPSYHRMDPPTELDTLYRAEDIGKKYLKTVILGNIPFADKKRNS